MKFVCTVCGYIYDEAREDTPFAELPEDWVCPLCGAPKALFEEKKEEAPVPEEKAETAPAAAPAPVTELQGDVLTELGPGEISALFSNLARGCEKQYQQEAASCFEKIADYFEARVPQENDSSLERLAALIRNDIDVNDAAHKAAAEAAGDRGALRVNVWGEKVSRMAASLIDRYLKSGEDFLKNTGLYVCTVCGFLYVGDNPPELCPVCRVPSWKFERIDGRAKR